jgi:hypothetical protein
MEVFTPQQRTQLRARLLAEATQDTRLSGGAITGSAVAGKEDIWSDIDLAFGVASDADIQDVLTTWTQKMYGQHQAVHHMDVHAGPWIYRVFFLENTLQVDLAFVPASDFRPLAPTFQLIFGTAGEPLNMPNPRAADLIGWAWLYAIHARSCIARGKVWQAEHMISAVRDHALMLACLRHNLPAAHGRGSDQLPVGLLATFEPALVRSLDAASLRASFAASVTALIHELEAAEPALAATLREPLLLLTRLDPA